ncbi:MAG: hypothetical protein IJB79_07320 [Candidatus Gastranaerophilales bacterium]|nr:hypothetical protein [Candidatus Gastranaerophilales bacterium]
MDISIFGNLGLIAIFIPLIFGLYLFISRFKKAFVYKKILNWGCFVSNIISFLIFLFVLFFAPENKILDCNFSYFSIEKFSLDFGFLINQDNILFLIFASFLAFIVSLYSKFYFDKKKQFIFTKQRFYAFLSILSSLTYLFLASNNLFQGMMILILQSVLILVFSNFDIFKNPTNYNITRFHRITQIGNFSLLVASLILFKYAILSEGYISSSSLIYEELNASISYMYGISSSFEFQFMTLALILAVFSRLMIFPFSCYYSFFANSSNILYLSTISIANNIVGMFLYLKILPLIELLQSYVLFFAGFLAFGILISLVQILFERNIKIVFGYLMVIFNSLFMILALIYNPELILCYYFGFNILFLLVLMVIFFKDKTNFKRRLINKQFGFVLEKAHILLFESFFIKISKIFEMIDEKIIQNILSPFDKLFNYLMSLFVKKVNRMNCVKTIKNILIIFALMALFAIFIALFGGFKC